VSVLRVRFSFLVLLVALLAVAGDSSAQATRPATPSNTSAQVIKPVAPPAKKSIYDEQTINTAANQPASVATTQSSASVQDEVVDRLDVPRIGLALATVISLIAALYWIYKKFFGGATAQRHSGAMSVLTRLAVTPKQHLVLLQVGRRIVLVADNGVQMSPLSEITDPDEVASLVGQLASDKSMSAVKAMNSFGNLFGRAQNSFDEPDDRLHRDVTDEPEPAAGDPSIEEARGEISGLMDKIRLLSGQIRRS
jgi:flagellar biogenesis protein FliO